MSDDRGPVRRIAGHLRQGMILALAIITASCGDPPPPSPEQVAIFAQDVDVELVVRAAPNAMRYESPTVEAPAGATVRLVMDNTETTSPAMVHNVVVVRFQPDVRRIGMAARGDDLPDDPAVLTATPLAVPRTRTAVVFTMPPPGRYPFFCSYPGHWQTMQGTLVSTP